MSTLILKSKKVPPLCLTVLAFACLALLPKAHAVTPAPDGGYPGGNTAEGTNALFSLTSGASNTALGNEALHNNNTGEENTAIGSQALFSNTARSDNTAIGFQALYYNTGGLANTAAGVHALYHNTSGFGNTATGIEALERNTTGQGNAANGADALQNNTVGDFNTAVGNQALEANFGGNGNTAIGAAALQTANASGNTAIGVSALSNDSTGGDNTAIGSGALFGNTSGLHNIGIGDSAGHNVGNGSYNIEIGNEGGTVPFDTRTIRIGTQGTQTRAFIAGIYNVNEGGTIRPVYMNSNGQLGTQPPASAQRFKREITSMDETSEAILALKPVTFCYKADETKTPQFGLIAEEVAKINPDLIIRDADGKPYTVRYDAVNVMLLNEFLKEHKAFVEEQRRIDNQEVRIKEQATTIARQQKQIEALTTGLQTVGAQLGASQGWLQVVLSQP